MKKILLLLLLFGIARADTLTVTTYTKVVDSVYTNVTAGTSLKSGLNHLVVDSSGDMYALVPVGSNIDMRLIYTGDQGSSFTETPSPLGKIYTYSGLASFGDSMFLIACSSTTSTSGVYLAKYKAGSQSWRDTVFGSPSPTGSASSSYPVMNVYGSGGIMATWRANDYLNSIYTMGMASWTQGGTWNRIDTQLYVMIGGQRLPLFNSLGYTVFYAENGDKLYSVDSLDGYDTLGTPVGVDLYSRYGVNTIRSSYSFAHIDDSASVGPIVGVAFADTFTAASKGQRIQFRRLLLKYGSGGRDTIVQIGSNVIIVDTGIIPMKVTNWPSTCTQVQLTSVGPLSDTLICTYTRPPDSADKRQQRICAKLSYNQGATWTGEFLIKDSLPTVSQYAQLTCPPWIPRNVPSAGQFTNWMMWRDSVATANLDSVSFTKAVWAPANTAKPTSLRHKPIQQGQHHDPVGPTSRHRP